jgi:hypothetical protein
VSWRVRAALTRSWDAGVDAPQRWVAGVVGSRGGGGLAGALAMADI